MVCRIVAVALLGGLLAPRAGLAQGVRIDTVLITVGDPFPAEEAQSFLPRGMRRPRPNASITAAATPAVTATVGMPRLR